MCTGFHPPVGERWKHRENEACSFCDATLDEMMMERYIDEEGGVVEADDEL